MTAEGDRRGRYDRNATPLARERATRRRVVLCAVDALAGGDPRGLSLAAVAERAGVSRTTLYQLFGDGRHLTRLAERVAARVVRTTLRAAASTAVTPLERLRALSRAWLELTDRPDPCGRLATRLACGVPPTRVHQALAEALDDALAVANASGLVARAPRPALVGALAAAWAHAAATRSTRADVPGISPEDLAELTWRVAR